MEIMYFFNFLLLMLFNNVHCSTPDQDGSGLAQDVHNGLADMDLILALAKRVDNLEKSNRFLVDRIDNLEKLNQDLQNSNIEAETVHQGQQQIINDLQTTVEQLRTTNQKQNRKLDIIERLLEKRYKDLEDPVTEKQPGISRSPIDNGSDDVTGVMGANGKDVDHHDQEGIRDVTGNREVARSRRQIELGERVAFFATTTKHLQNLGPDQVIEFNNVTTNIGNAYNSNTGVFTAPFAGTYVFSTSLMGVTPGHNTYYYIAKNHAMVSMLHIHGQQSPYTTTSITVVLQLHQGDDVEVRNRDGNEGVYGNSHSCFSGFLLYFGDGSSNNIVVG